MDYLYLISIGLLGGFLAGLLGVGGGIIYILVLPFIFERKEVCDESLVPLVVANSILASLIASFSANIKRIFQKEFEYAEVFYIGIGGIATSILTMIYVVESEFYSRMTFNVVVIILLTFMITRLFYRNEASLIEKRLSVPKLVLIGLIAGIISALSGLGGGVIIVPLLALFFEMDVKKAKNISLGVIGFMAFFFSIRNVLADVDCNAIFGQQGLLIFPVTLVIGLGVVVGAPLGMKFSRSISAKSIKIIFTVMLLVVIAKKGMEIIQYLG